MKKLLLCWMLWVSAFHCNASIISISADNTQVAVGDIVNISVLGDFAEFDTFEILIGFNQQVFSLVDDSFSSLLITQASDFFEGFLLEPSLISAVFFGDDGAFGGSPVTFTGALTLFTFSLQAMSAGIGQFNVESVFMFLSSTDEDVIISQALGTAVTVQEVSAPTTMGLMALVLSLLLVRRLSSSH